ncbi:39S ribosomal protein L42, mitochondrial isoform X2 [Phocoena sinus]|uniref:Large ribosomal subunit protein mL42 n=1 Tax=Phocoena sinus TaxID=42100 RepID=A0A8C9CQ70_PHOSS|nr:39S ribosomal protein L42, mitochondrial isoform X2 [Phocoena sinus]XP_032502892.1 39S ribosomal protein L42, mitochondrial isoform X2 [Phocoena sinus]XP_032502893.1 39S ribosomal protein L42, mitochondrial isoform X2 [Phocoena sinus]XP_032502894.1 39S ribosomal protein L42, mitochondrial isoform X2 [Phocoena sinus]XP_032502895.1 39S ribosomal protein L42, mitochondrial isoform X2 [Phocoena sinus]XP_032502896.1 39S ribosomal protein L42, mitochondrial isoform X2 [Phocoena sinus]
MALAAVKWAISSRTILKHLFPIQITYLSRGIILFLKMKELEFSCPQKLNQSCISDGALYCVCHKTTYSSLPDDYNCKVELALTSDGRTIVCYHPSVDIPYEHTKPIPRPDPVQNNEETHDLVLKTRLEEKGEYLEQGPMIEQLSKMFFTTKHRWYPRGQYHRRRRKLNPPKDR